MVDLEQASINTHQLTLQINVERGNAVATTSGGGTTNRRNMEGAEVESRFTRDQPTKQVTLLNQIFIPITILRFSSALI
jgi:hypothetical protein